MLKRWEDLPDFMRIPQVRPYWESLSEKKGRLLVKRVFDIVIAGMLLCILLIPMLVIAFMIKADSRGPVFYRHERVTAYGRRFRIHKFRTMIKDAENLGDTVTAADDARITPMGKKLRRYKLDELPQLIDVLRGDMTFVGTRPEAVKYVEAYRPGYYATLLLPAGITSEASIRFRNEEKLLSRSEDVDKAYLTRILPEKMKLNLASIRSFSLLKEFVTLLKTMFLVLR
ncbi:MAG: sugar transferase [Lachnospiraceae bacterium]|nr:sugar transferase [Lachnospiraceae bacterium]